MRSARQQNVTKIEAAKPNAAISQKAVESPVTMRWNMAGMLSR